MNALQQKADNTVLFAVPKEVQKRGKSKYKGLFKQVGSPNWHIQFTDAKGIRRKESSGSEDHRVALNLLEDRKAAVRSGNLIFDNSQMQKVQFKDFVMEGLRIYAGTNEGGFTMEEAEVLLNGGLEQRKALQAELEKVRLQGKRPRFRYRSKVGFFDLVKNWLRQIGNMEVKDIDYDTITTELDRFRKPTKNRPEGRGEGYSNGYLSAFKTVFDHASISKKYLPYKFQTPVRWKLHGKKLVKKVRRYINEDERKRYLNAIHNNEWRWGVPPGVIADMSEFLWLTGFRDSTITDAVEGIRVGQLNMDLGFGFVQLSAEQTKGDVAQTVEFRYARVREIVMKHIQRKGKNDYLFSWKRGQNVSQNLFIDCFNRTAAKAGLSNVRPHDLRKAYAMDRMIGVYENACNISDVMVELFHKMSTTTEEYIDRKVIAAERKKRGLV